MKLYVARHGQTEYNSKNLVCGSTNLPLTELGKEQAKALAEKLKDKNIDVIIAYDACNADCRCGEPCNGYSGYDGQTPA